ncbi:hypothetical protein ACQR3P_14775 [Rhodococcus sp. IEGM1300]
MSSLFKFNNFFAALAVVTASTSALAEEPNPIGDWWIIYGNGIAHKNIMYVADRTSVLPSPKTKGAQLVAVTLVYEEPGKPMIDAYNLEVQCPTRKVRFLNGQSVERIGYTLRHLKVNDKWQEPKELWVQRSFEFVCKPGNKDSVAMGKMDYMQMINVSQQMFFKLAPVQENSKMMDDLDNILGNKQ